MKRFDTAPRPGQIYRRRPGAYAILPMQNGILATFQGGRHQEFQLPGGGIEPGESPIPALHREVFEETGWHISRPRQVYRFKRFVFMPDYDMWAEKICTIYVARPTFQITDPPEADHSPTWLPYPTAVKSLAVSGDRAALSMFLKLGR